MKRLITRDRYEGLDPEIAQALKDGKMVKGKDPIVGECWLDDYNSVTGVYTVFYDNKAKSTYMSFTPAYETDATPDETTPVDTICEVWDDDREDSTHRYFRGIGKDGHFICCAYKTTSKNSYHKYSLWRHARIIEYPDGTKPGEE